MRFRQIHLDFHTSEMIKDIGKRFSKSQFQEMLKAGHVDSITIFAKCHHGWAYFPSETNEMHPHLDFDLLGAQIEAAHEIGVKTPVYLSVGFDEKLARHHPEWLMRDENDQTNWVKGFMTAGWHQFCLNSPYLDLMVSQVEEAVRKYDGDGIFLDIVGVRTCYCHTCVADLRAEGKDPRNKSDVVAQGERIYANYTRRIKEAVHAIKPDMPIFHNAGHISQGRRDLAAMNSHLELESLPTGGWGYDHFPLSARYAQLLGMDFLGMTGKFHTFWGEFGGYKHPNALRYETALSLANGARCSIGDQLHPEGLMDRGTYELIGAAYSEVEQKEAWITDTVNIADVALLTAEAAGVGSADSSMFTGRADAGAVRMLLEGKFLFDVVDLDVDFKAYKVLVLPDQIVISDQLKAKLDDFFNQGGKVLATGKSGLDPTGNEFVINLGVKRIMENPYQPDYFRPAFSLANLGDSSFIMYAKGQKVALNGGTEIGRREDPYFNRDVFTFCSHQHTPSSMNDGGPGMVESDKGIYIAWNLFEDYAVKGSLSLKETAVYALNRLLPDKTLTTNLPAQGIVTLQEQQAQGRIVNHLLYASPVKRGENVEIIEDILPVYDISVSIIVQDMAKQVYLAPQMTPIPYQQNGQKIDYVVPKLECHQMVVIDFESRSSN
ncbi:alpha-amylase family protein [Cohnella silvisoli]|uniref:Beta-galactosidase trimerization domain-containing protein n=1 Tax=Cohnella silvisoli TaxID=2873699 RepID=A0ABV1KQ93_9BACL|nr:alpha-amylase family protein [Cohnella silvisoli]MCD9022102.1 beta-galactosidase trimerization domain-containing protein [Cohnella silvisoli]